MLNHRLLKYGLRITEALFAKLIIIVEGSTDAIVIGRLLEIKSGRSSDQMDLLITPANGKDNMTDIAEILEKLGVNWMAIFDFDAAMSTSSIPITINPFNSPEEGEMLDSLDTLLANLDIRQKRGRKTKTQLELLKYEIEFGQPTCSFYDDSTLQVMMERVLSTSARSISSLKSAIRKNKVQIIRKILGSRGIWLMRPDLEYTLIGREKSNITIIDPILRKYRILKISANSPNYERSVINALHKLSNKPDVLIKVVDAIDKAGGFNRTDISLAVKRILDIVK